MSYLLRKLCGKWGKTQARANAQGGMDFVEWLIENNHLDKLKPLSLSKINKIYIETHDHCYDGVAAINFLRRYTKEIK